MSFSCLPIFILLSYSNIYKLTHTQLFLHNRIPQPLCRNYPPLHPNLHILAPSPHPPKAHQHHHPRRQRLLLQPIQHPTLHLRTPPIPRLWRLSPRSPQNRSRFLRRPSNLPNRRPPLPLPPSIPVHPLNQRRPIASPQPSASRPLRRPRKSRLGLRHRHSRLRHLALPALFPLPPQQPRRTRHPQLLHPSPTLRPGHRV